MQKKLFIKSKVAGAGGVALNNISSGSIPDFRPFFLLVLD